MVYLKKNDPPVSFIIRILSIIIMIAMNLGGGSEYFVFSLIMVVVCWVISFAIQSEEIDEQIKDEKRNREREEELFKSIFGNYTIQEEARRKQLRDNTTKKE